MERPSPCAENLTRLQFKQKVNIIGGLDPFLKNELSLSLIKRLELPNTTQSTIVSCIQDHDVHAH